ncbi:MAG: ABC transporter permease [Desulfurococcaceae archaeon]
MLSSLRRAYAVFKAYFVSDLVRSRGFIYGLISFSFWIILFLAPVSLFMGGEVDQHIVASYAFASLFIFMVYSIATWDWAAELRWMINNGILEYYIATGSGILPHYLGLIPVSLMWFGLSLTVNYIMITIFIGPPKIIIYDTIMFLAAFTMMILVVFGYALFLGATMVSSGVSGFIVEFLSFLLPISTGGLTPLSRLPIYVRNFALATPFSYPAELIRYSILGMEPVLNIEKMILIGYCYATLFFTAGLAYFKYQFRKGLKKGFVQASLW